MLAEQWGSLYPDGDPVQFWVDLMGAAYDQSGWMSNTCWTSSVHRSGTYFWHVQAMDSHGFKSAYTTDWSFTVNQNSTPTPTPTMIANPFLSPVYIPMIMDSHYH